MNRETIHDDILELGVASLDTKGSFVTGEDHEVGKLPAQGLTDD